jgi:D-alanyl-D-alanine carboxypeptidase
VGCTTGGTTASPTTPSQTTATSPTSADFAPATEPKPITTPPPPAPTTTSTTLPPLVVDPGAAAYVPLPPARLLDSRDLGLPLVGGKLRVLPVAGAAGLPASGMAAIAVNVTAINTDDVGSLVVWTAGTQAPLSPSLAVAGAGDAVGKLIVTVPNAAGEIALQSTTGMDVLIDVVGWFRQSPAGSADGRYVRGPGTRVVDSVKSLATPGALPAGGRIDVAIAGVGAIPADATAVALKVDLFESVPVGFVTIWPTGSPPPGVSQLQVPPAGYTATNVVMVAPGEGGKVSLLTSAATGLSVDVVGWFTGASSPKTSEGLFVALNPPLLLDAGGLEPPYRHDVTLRTAGGLPTQSGAAVFADVIAADAADAGNVSLSAARTPKATVNSLPVQGIGTTTVSPSLVSVGEGDRLSLSAQQRVNVSLLVRGYIIGRPTPPDPTLPPEPATADGTPAIAAFDAVIEQLLASTGSVGASVAVAKDGRIVYARAYGVRDVDTGDPTKINSRYRFASMTKVLTAATLLQLVQAGGIALDDPVFAVLATRVPLPVGHDPRLDTITVRQLLSHTSGLRHSPDVFFNEEPGVADAFGPGGPTSCAQAAQWFVQFPLARDPGTQFDYVNMNYCLAGLLIEELTGEKFDAAVKNLTLERRGVTDVVVGRSHLFGPTDVTHRTPPVDVPGGGNFMESIGGAGALTGTPIDLVRFLDGLDPDKPGPHLLTPELYQQFTTVQPGLGGWGLGAEVFGSGSFGHSGSLDGARGAMVHRGDGFTYAITVNGSFKSHSSTLRDAVARAIATVPTWPTWSYNNELP